MARGRVVQPSLGDVDRVLHAVAGPPVSLTVWSHPGDAVLVQGVAREAPSPCRPRGPTGRKAKLCAGGAGGCHLPGLG